MEPITVAANAVQANAPTNWPILLIVGMAMVVISIGIMVAAIRLGKRWKKFRTPEEWSLSELFWVSTFLNAWHLWAVCNRNHNRSHSHTTFNDKDELDVAFRKFTEEMLHTGALDVHFNTDQLMQELLAYDGRDLAKPFGLDTRSMANNDKRVVFAQLYADRLRKLYFELLK